MSTRGTDYQRLLDELQAIVRRTPGAELRSLADEQVIVRKSMVANPAARKGLKASAQVPGVHGYALFVDWRGADARAEPSARMRPPPQSPGPCPRVRLAPAEREGSWTIAAAGGDEVFVTVTVGAQAPRSEVDALLRAVDAALRP
jgi:hypothetical protein